MTKMLDCARFPQATCALREARASLSLCSPGNLCLRRSMKISSLSGHSAAGLTQRAVWISALESANFAGVNTTGSQTGMTAPAPDIDELRTEIASLKRELERTRQELEETRKTTTRYLQNVAHQLTAPLNAIKWNIEAIKDEAVSIHRKKNSF